MSKKRVLITGADGTVGRALRAGLSDAFEVVACGRAELDVEDEASWRAQMAKLPSLYGLIHTPGRFVHGPIGDGDAAELRATINSNLLSAMLAHRHGIEALRRGRGRLVYFTLAGSDQLRPEPNLAAYAAAKAGLTSWLRSVAAVEAEHGVTCNAIAPGLLHNTGDDEVARYRIPAGRRAEAAELVEAVRFLLSPSAAQITGSSIPLSGGWRL